MANIKIFISSLFALGFLVLTFTVHWAFIIVAIILMLWNQRQLMKHKKN